MPSIVSETAFRLRRRYSRFDPAELANYRPARRPLSIASRVFPIVPEGCERLLGILLNMIWMMREEFHSLRIRYSINRLHL